MEKEKTIVVGQIVFWATLILDLLGAYTSTPATNRSNLLQNSVIKVQQKTPTETCRGFKKDLAPTYSRRSYTTTTIGKAAFDGRVRDGNGSDHSFMGTKKSFGQ